MTQAEDINRVRGQHPGFRFVQLTASAERIGNLQRERKDNNRALLTMWATAVIVIGTAFWLASR